MVIFIILGTGIGIKQIVILIILGTGIEI